MADNDYQVSNILHRFAEFLRSGKIVFLVGAGISHDYPSLLPLAEQIQKAILLNVYQHSRLLPALLSSTSRITSQEAFLRLFAGGSRQQLRFESLLQLVSDTVGDLSILSVLKRKSVNHYHRFLVSALHSGNQVITTNFDTLIETAYGSSSPIQAIATESEFRQVYRRIGKAPLLFKIHGSLDHEESIKATLHQIGMSGIAFMWEKGKGSVLNRLLQRYHLIVLGYSGMDDMDILPKLSLVDSKTEVLWIDHTVHQPQVLSKGEISRRFRSSDMRRFLETRRAHVINGDSCQVVAFLSRAALGKNLVIEQPRKKGGDVSYEARIAHQFEKWANRNPNMIDFMAGRLLYAVNRTALSRRMFLQLERAFHTSGDARNHTKALTDLATCCADLGDTTEAIAYQEQAILHAEHQGVASDLCDYLINLAGLKIRLRGYGEAESILKRAHKLGSRHSLVMQKARVALSLGEIFLTTARYQEARLWLERAYSGFKHIGDLQGYAAALGMLGNVAYIEDEEPNKVETFFRMALEHAVRLGDVAMEAALWVNLGGIYRRQGAVETSLNAYDQAIRIAKRTHNRKSVVLAEMGICTLKLMCGENAEAIQIGNTAVQIGRSLGLLDHAAQTAGNIGLALLSEGRFTEALEYFEMAEQDFEALKLPYELAFTYQNMGRCLMELGERARADLVLRTAESLYTQIGLLDRAEETRTVLVGLEPS